LLLLLVAALIAVSMAKSALFDSAPHIQTVNQQEVGWEAGKNVYFEGRTEDSVKRLMGTRLKAGDHGLPEIQHPETTLPTNFDSRQQWPTCVGAVRNQGDCGSCWAFGCAEALSDRFCIDSKGAIVVTLAPLDIVACDKADSGCEGGELASAWDFTMKTGIVDEGCAPYNDSIPTCPPAQQPCLNFVPTPACPNKCVNGETWTGAKHFASKVYAVRAIPEQIATEIYTNGPVEAAFTVYADFVNYKSGVYKHTTGKVLGGHAIKMIGFGVENGTEYWLCQNSWTNTWGDDGYFKILKGVDECGIESNVVAGFANVSK